MKLGKHLLEGLKMAALFADVPEALANTVEIAIIDRGVGLRPTLSRNPHLTIASDHDAIMYALSPGISGKFYEGVRIDRNNPYQNSGFGLYMNCRLCN